MKRHRQVRPIDREAMKKAGVEVKWKRGTGSTVIANKDWARGIFVHHVMWVDEKERPLYDRAVIAHRGGAMILPVDKRGRIGLIQKWQPQPSDPEKYWAEFPNIKIEELGRQSYEIPGGVAENGEALEDTARRELLYEGGLVTKRVHSMGFLGGDPPSIVHMDEYFWCRARPADRKPKMDTLEGITQTAKFYTPQQVLKLVRSGKLYDTRTLAALSAFWLLQPK